MLERQILERMRRAGRVEQVAREHRVGLEPAERDAVACEDDRVELQIVTDLAIDCVFEDGLESARASITSTSTAVRGLAPPAIRRTDRRRRSTLASGT